MAPLFELERFEPVDAGRGRILLRLSGRWRPRQPERDFDARLVVDDGRSRQLIAPLTGSQEVAAESALWWVAFRIPITLAQSGAVTYALEVSGETFDLPPPSEPGRRAPRAAARALHDDEERRPPADADATAQGREAMRELEQRLAAERVARARAEQEALDAREELARVRAELRSTRVQSAAAQAQLAERQTAELGVRDASSTRAQLAQAHVAALSRELEQARARELAAARRAAHARRVTSAVEQREAQAAASAAGDPPAVRAARAAAAEKMVEAAHVVARERERAAVEAQAATARAADALARARQLERETGSEPEQSHGRPATPREAAAPRVDIQPAGAALSVRAIAQRVRRVLRQAVTREQPTSDRRARIFVWACWGLLFTSSVCLVLIDGRNVPIQEDWHIIAAATGNQFEFWDWVWKPNNEHRVPIAKLVYVALFQLWPDFRVGMIFNLAALAAIAAAFVVFMRRLRGHTRWTDAFFPLIFLHLGNWENFGWSWQLTFVIAAGVAAAMLMLVAAGGGWTTWRASLLVACLIVTPFTGATALPFAAAIAVAVLIECRNIAGRPRVLLAAGAVLTLLLSGLYFVDLPESTWVPGNPGLASDLWTGGKFLALGLGPAAGGWWMVSVIAAVGAIASATWLLWRARRRAAWPLLAFVGAGVALAGSLGRGRSGAVEFYGLPDRYVLVAAPLICAIYLVWERFGGVRLRRLGPAALCAVMLLLLPLNTVYGAQWKDWYHERVDTFAADVEGGVPLAQLIRYRPLGQDAHEMALGMLYMREYKIGVFRKVRLVPPSVRGWAIDGFRSGGAGWQTLRGPTARARLIDRGGQREMRWDYNATRTVPAALGRSFATPADWTGAGALAFTVTGEGSQRRIRVRLLVDAPDGGVDRFDTWFTDATAKTTTLVVPWNGFGRANVRGEFVDVLKGPLPLNAVRSVTFIIGDTGPGVLRIKRLALTPGHSQLGWPLHSAVQRTSLPPLQ